jgi:hypothetical protein
MDLKYFQNFADSMPKRMQWLIENNGEFTKYLLDSDDVKFFI